MVKEQETKNPNESGNFLSVDPSTLMRDNPAALIVNTESYGLMEAHFAPEQLDPPQVVKVTTYSSRHGLTIKTFVVDGMTRTKFASDHKGQAIPGHPNFSFDSITVRDVTRSVLRNPVIVPDAERQPSQETLTMVQYLRAVVPPTREHSEIAPDRIAAHLVNGWENMVGDKLSRKFSAMAALSLLANRNIPSATEALLKKYLDSQEKLIAGETDADRRILQQGLLNTAEVIREAKLLKSEVARAAFELVSAQSPVIGGEREARKQVYGLLYTPRIERKLEGKFTRVAEREEGRIQLGKTLEDAFFNVSSQKQDRQTVLNQLGDAIDNPDLDLSQTVEVLTADDPVDAYRNIRREINKDKLNKSYMTVTSKDQLTAVERRLIDQLGDRTVLDSSDLPSLVRAVQTGSATVSSARKKASELVSQRERLINSGVQESLLETSVERLRSMASELETANSAQTIARKVGELTSVLRDFEQKIQRQVYRHRVGAVVEEVYGTQVKEGFGTDIKAVVVNYIVRDMENASNTEIKQRLTTLKKLDSDLQSQVANGTIRLNRALQIQENRNRPRPSLPQAPVRSTRIETPTSPRTPPAPIPSEPDLNRKTAEERRVSINNNKLRQIAYDFAKGLANLDLDSEEVSQETKKQTDELLNALGKLLYKHPNIVRIIEEHYPALQQEVGQLRSRLLLQEQEHAAKDARTKR